MDSKYGAEPSHYPDGLTEQAIDELLRELDVAVMAKPRPTTPLMDGTGAQRRNRRQAHRYASAVSRAWSARGATDGTPGGWAA